MNLDPATLSTGAMYAWMVNLITPRPIAWVSTLSREGVANLAPFSFFNGVGANPPTLMFCPSNRRDGTAKDTLSNIREQGEFVVNLVTDEVVEAMNMTAAEYAPDVDEFRMAKVDAATSRQVKPPRVAGSAASIECQLYREMAIGEGPGGANVVIGRIVAIHVQDSLVRGGRLDADRLATVGRMGGNGYVRTSDRFDLPRPTL